MRAPSPARAAGFTVFEILVALALMAVMAAVTIPALMGRIRDARTSALSQSLFALSQAIFEYKKAVSTYPPTLDVLATKPTAATTDACGTLISANAANNWRGPYVSRELVSGGVNIGDARISNTLRRQSGPPVILFIDVESVDSTSVIDLETQFDGSGANPSTTGTVRYGTVAIPLTGIGAALPHTYNVEYGIPITGC